LTEAASVRAAAPVPEAGAATFRSAVVAFHDARNDFNVDAAVSAFLEWLEGARKEDRALAERVLEALESQQHAKLPFNKASSVGRRAVMTRLRWAPSSAFDLLAGDQILRYVTVAAYGPEARAPAFGA